MPTFNALLLTDDVTAYQACLADYALDDLTLYYAVSVAAAQPYLAECEILFGRPDYCAAVLKQMPKLQWLQSTYAGIEHLCVPDLPQHYQLSNIRGIFGPLISEYVMGYLIALERKFWLARQQQQAGIWQDESLAYRSLQGLSIGIAGLGSIGLHVAQTAKHFGMRVSGLKRSAPTVEDTAFALLDQIFTPEQDAEFLRDLDYLVMVLPATTATQQFMNAERLRYLKPEAVLINVGRGSSVDEKALVEVLAAKRLRAAVLDVFQHEPLSSDSPLWHLDNAYLTPHVAARSFPQQVTKIFADNYQRFRQGKALAYQIDFQRGY